MVLIIKEENCEGGVGGFKSHLKVQEVKSALSHVSRSTIEAQFIQQYINSGVETPYKEL